METHGDCSTGPRVIFEGICSPKTGDETKCQYCGKLAVFIKTQWFHACDVKWHLQEESEVARVFQAKREIQAGEMVTTKDVEAVRRENRFKMLMIPEHLILDILNFHRQQGHVLALPACGELPPDAVADAISYEYPYKALTIRVWSSEFPIVPDGEQIPEIDPMFVFINMEQYEIIPKGPADQPTDLPASDPVTDFFFGKP